MNDPIPPSSTRPMRVTLASSVAPAETRSRANGLVAMLVVLAVLISGTEFLFLGPRSSDPAGQGSGQPIDAITGAVRALLGGLESGEVSSRDAKAAPRGAVMVMASTAMLDLRRIEREGLAKVAAFGGGTTGQIATAAGVVVKDPTIADANAGRVGFGPPAGSGSSTAGGDTAGVVGLTGSGGSGSSAGSDSGSAGGSAPASGGGGSGSGSGSGGGSGGGSGSVGSGLAPSLSIGPAPTPRPATPRPSATPPPLLQPVQSLPALLPPATPKPPPTPTPRPTPTPTPILPLPPLPLPTATLPLPTVNPLPLP